MTAAHASTRRSFIWIAGAALSGPVAAAAAAVPSIAVSATGDGDDASTRLAMLEDVNAIRALNQAYARHVNAGAHAEASALFLDAAHGRVNPEIRAIATDHFGEHDVIEIAADRQTSTARVHCLVHAESELPDCPLVAMARQQGGGVVPREERGVFEKSYVRVEGGWKIHRSTYCVA